MNHKVHTQRDQKCAGQYPQKFRLPSRAPITVVNAVTIVTTAKIGTVMSHWYIMNSPLFMIIHYYL